MDAAAPRDDARCRLCGAGLTGPYCQACGQPSVAVRRTFRDAITGHTGRLLHSLRVLVTQPGGLAREIDEARDRASMRPGALLTNLIAVFFLLAGGIGGFTADALVAQDRSGRLAGVVAHRADDRGVGTAVYHERLESRFRSTYSVLITLSSLAYGAALWLVERRRGKAWVVHLAAGVQYLCVTFLLSALLYGGSRLVGYDLAGHPGVGLALVGVLGVYIVLMLRHLYADAWPWAVAKALVVLAIGALSDSILAYAALAIALVAA
jgi:hypothetical protein